VKPSKPSRPSPTLYGVPVTLSEFLTVAGEPYQVPRSWRERLFGRGAWRPNGDRPTDTIVPQVPSRDIYKLPNGFLMHPAMWTELQHQLAGKGTDR